MAGEPWAKFFWKDWESDPALKLCSLAAQGLWMRLLCIAAASTIKGEVRIGRRPCTPEDIAELVGKVNPDEVRELLAELESRGVFSRKKDGTIISRRMVRDAKKHAAKRKTGKGGGRPKLLEEQDNSDNQNIAYAGARAASAYASREDLSFLEGRGAGEGRVPADHRRLFEVWWVEYPEKVGKAAAQRSYKSALARASPDDLLAGLSRYVTSKPDDQRWCHPTTWLNQDRWLDEPAPEPEPRINGHGYRSPATSLFEGFAEAASGDRGVGGPPAHALLDRK